MRLYNSGCGCVVDADARVMVCCDRPGHMANPSFDYQRITREQLVARADQWIALAPSLAAMMDRVQVAENGGITSTELLGAAITRAALA